MFEKERNYPSAVTAGPELGDRSLKDGLTWLVNRVSELGGQPLVFAPGMSNVRDVPLLEQFTKVQGVAVGTWRGIRDWHGGPVLAVWPSRVKLGEIADDRRTTALCVVPWVSGGLDAWQAAADPDQAEDLRAAFAQVRTAYQQQGLTISAFQATPVLDILKQADKTMNSWKPKVASYVATAHKLAARAIAIADAAASAVC